MLITHYQALTESELLYCDPHESSKRLLSSKITWVEASTWHFGRYVYFGNTEVRKCKMKRKSVRNLPITTALRLVAIIVTTQKLRVTQFWVGYNLIVPDYLRSTALTLNVLSLLEVLVWFFVKSPIQSQQLLSETLNVRFLW